MRVVNIFSGKAQVDTSQVSGISGFVNTMVDLYRYGLCSMGALNISGAEYSGCFLVNHTEYDVTIEKLGKGFKYCINGQTYNTAQAIEYMKSLDTRVVPDNILLHYAKLFGVGKSALVDAINNIGETGTIPYGLGVSTSLNKEDGVWLTLSMSSGNKAVNPSINIVIMYKGHVVWSYKSRNYYLEWDDGLLDIFLRGILEIYNITPTTPAFIMFANSDTYGRTDFASLRDKLYYNFKYCESSINQNPMVI